MEFIRQCFFDKQKCDKAKAEDEPRATSINDCDGVAFDRTCNREHLDESSSDVERSN